jgi:flagellar motor switch protein FliM
MFEKRESIINWIWVTDERDLGEREKRMLKGLLTGMYEKIQESVTDIIGSEWVMNEGDS